MDARASPVRESRHKPGAWLEGRSRLRFAELSAGGQPGDEQRRRRRRAEQAEGNAEEASEMESASESRKLEPLLEGPAELQAQALERPADGARQLAALLQIDSLSSEDNGLYKCRVDFRRARSRIEETELRIIGK